MSARTVRRLRGPAVTPPVEIYSAPRQAEFLLSNAVDPVSYEEAREEVRRLGLDPDAVPHRRPVP